MLRFTIDSPRRPACVSQRKHRRRRLLNVTITVATVCVFMTVADPSAAQQSERPNVVVILTDDQGWGDLSLHGNPNLSTPNIDSLARGGAQIRNFYVCAVCSPTRAEFLTGRYHTRLGVYSTSTGGERFDAAEQTIGDVFKSAGYATAAYGKWHSGMQYPYHPNARGFDDFFGFCSGHWGHYFSPMLEHNGRIVEGDGYLVDDLTDHAIDFIDRHRDHPFFVYLPLNTPHSPMQVPDEYWQRFAGKELVPDPAEENAKRQDDQHTRAALAMCENIDANVGRLLRHLDDTSLADRTVVVFFCDNGPNGWRFNGGLRGRKGSTFEGGVRSPCLVRYPSGIAPGTVVERIGGAVDLLPTLTELAGVTLESPRPLDGHSLAANLTGDGRVPERLLFTAWRRKASVRSQRYRYHHTGQLFDIESDPGEREDVADEFPEVTARMREALQSWMAETESGTHLRTDSRPFTLAHPEAEFTQLPARDAVPHGNIERSNRFPNCTFMRNWTSTDDSITWDVDVLSDGDYEVQMYYACPEESVGSKLELVMGDSRLTATIDTANASPLIGAAHDRVPRMEGYVKDWRPMTLGTIRLRPGRQTLTLRALEIPGEKVADMRLLMFRRP